MNRFLITCMLIFGAAICSNAQEMVEVTGTVRDAKGVPLPYVNVFMKNTTGVGTTTLADGTYKIKVETFQRLSFLLIGFQTQEILVKEQGVIDVVMAEEEASVLDEVVVTGTGAQKKLTVTGAITTVNMTELKSNPSSSVVNALSGNVPGIMAMTTSGQPGKNISEFWIRGISTFGGGSSAYILVDGFERDMNELNIEDIESISVLKDASTTAIYGSKGANGVILITTKRGKSGKINVDAKVEAAYNTRTITPEFVDGFTYADLINEANVTRNRAPVYQPEEIEILRMGLDPDLYPNVDWKNLLLKDGAMSYRANININGGGSTARYFVSGSYVEEQGMYNTDAAIRNDYNTNANYSRWNYRMNIDVDITKTTLVKFGVSGYLSKRNSPGLGDADVWGELFGYSPIRTPIMYSNGYFPAIGTGNKTNPWVAATQTGFKENWKNSIQTNISLEQNLDFITQGLRFTGRFGYDVINDNEIRRLKWPEQWRAERMRDSNGNLVFTHISDPHEMHQESSSNGERREFYEAMLNYDRNIAEHHHVGATLKYNSDAFRWTQNLGGDLKNGVARRNQALAGRVAYNWKYRYFIDFNFGYTGSENFAKGHQYGFFPAYSVAWNIAEESFVKENVKWINMFKVRYSHGKVGNDKLIDNERFPYLYLIEGGASGYNWGEYGNSDRNYSGMRYTEIASPYVTWEIATKNDIGLDISLFRDRFIANVDYFDENREGIYMSRSYLPQMVGLEGRAPRANVGKVRTRGFDGRVEIKQKLGNVNLTVRGNITYSKNEVLEKDEANNVYPYQMEKGYRVDQQKGLIALGLFKDYDDIRNSPKQDFKYTVTQNGKRANDPYVCQPGDIKYKDVNGDGVINDGDRVAIGSTRRPNLIYGVGASASWKGLDISLHFQGAGKSTFPIYGKTVWAFSENQWGTLLKDMVSDDRWIAADISGNPATENPNAAYPRLSYGENPNNYRSSSFWLRNGAYLRLKTVDIGYTLPKNLVNKVKINNVRVFLVGTNLLTWSSFKLWDPETTNPRGEDYPLTKSITFGLSIKL